jgi:DNA-binding transcriptional LysR family regulator
MNLRQTEIFCAVMRCRTTTTAAYELGVSQPSVSNAVKHLEDQLGLLLFKTIGSLRRFTYG